MAIFIQFLIVSLLLATMILVLLGIGHLNHISDFDSQEETENLKEEIDNSEEVVSNNNAFHKFVEDKFVEDKEENNFQISSKSNSFTHNEPSSRKL